MAVADRGAGARDAGGVARRPRGFALLIVLGTLGLVALLVASLAAAGRSDLRSAAALRDAARAEAAADGAIAAATFALLQGAVPPETLRIGDATVRLRVTSEAGRINPNVARQPLLQALLTEVGVPPARATALAAAIVDWRSPGGQRSERGAKAAEYREDGRDYGPPGGAFRDVSELRLVLGMTEPVIAALTPHLTLWRDADPDPALADAIVRRAMADAGDARRPGATGGGDRVLSIVARAELAGGVVTRRRAVVRFSPTPDGRDIQVLARDNVAE